MECQNWGVLEPDHSLCCTNFMGHLVRYIFFSDWMNKTFYIRKKKQTTNPTTEWGASGTNTWRTTHSFLKFMPLSHTRVVTYLAVVQVLVNNIKHNLGIEGTEHRSFSCKTSTDQILKKYIYIQLFLLTVFAVKQNLLTQMALC